MDRARSASASAVAWLGCVVGLALGSGAGGFTLPAVRADDAAHELQLVLFMRGDTEPCRKAVAFAAEFPRQHPGTRVVVHDLLEDERALDEYWAIADRLGVKEPTLPAWYALGRFLQGFEDSKTTGPAIEALFDLDVYSREGCPHCRDAKRFLAGLAQRWPALRVRIHDLSSDPAARQQMYDVARRGGVSPTGLPVIAVAGKVFVGYATDATSGRRLEAVLEQYEATEPTQETRRNAAPPARATGYRWVLSPQGALFGWVELDGRAESRPPPRPRRPVPGGHAPLDGPSTPIAPTPVAPPTDEPPAGIELPGLGLLKVEDWGLPLFTLVIGLIDGFNPCAMWVLVFLLSVLVNVHSRAKMLAIAGTFVAVSGLAYFAFMAAWLNMFLLLDLERPLQIVLGLLALFIGAVNVKDFFAFKRGLTLSIPESAKPGIYDRVRRIVATKYLSVAVGLAIVLALGVNMVELLCTAGLPALYTQILTSHSLPWWQNYAYLALYNLAYMADDALLLLTFVVTLSHRKLQEREGRWLKLVSGVVVLALGLVMLLRPDWLRW